MAVRRRTRLSAAGIAVLGLLLGVPGPAGADEVPAHELKAVIGTLAALDRELRALYERAAFLDADDGALAALESRIDEVLVAKRDELDRRLAVNAMHRVQPGSEAPLPAELARSLKREQLRIEAVLGGPRWPLQLDLVRQAAADRARRAGVRPGRSPEVRALTLAVEAAIAEARLGRLAEAAGAGRGGGSRPELQLADRRRAVLLRLNRARAALMRRERGLRARQAALPADGSDVARSLELAEGIHANLKTQVHVHDVLEHVDPEGARTGLTRATVLRRAREQIDQRIESWTAETAIGDARHRLHLARTADAMPPAERSDQPAPAVIPADRPAVHDLVPATLVGPPGPAPPAPGAASLKTPARLGSQEDEGSPAGEEPGDEIVRWQQLDGMLLSGGLAGVRLGAPAEAPSVASPLKRR
jgi:hypothetical protein